MDFQLKADQEFIELNKLLKAVSMVGTGGEAKIRIKSGEVVVNDAVEVQVRKKLRRGDVVVFGEAVIEIQ